MSNEIRCDQPAVAKYSWPGDPNDHHACAEHLRKAAGLLQFMGYRLFTALPDKGATCDQMVQPKSSHEETHA